MTTPLNETMLKLSKAAQAIIDLTSEQFVIENMIEAHDLTTASPEELQDLTPAEWGHLRATLQALATDAAIEAKRDAIYKAASKQRELTLLVRG